MSAEEQKDQLVRELRVRIDELMLPDESRLGGFHALDWWICALGFTLLPAVLILWFAPK